ncbi:RDD family protein [Phenylobacterium montanum]|uniref:RDD family protein n=1 Tax=Phenylobacterium montanum TaxID=2823693 RepID=A0A975FVS6_9CAUL|nr:RDD family protein [Caulobacter sp. S6]QUD86194.1 RDD family protein [Caulobacter sp. S6]
MAEAAARQRALVTPEGMDLRLRLAEASERAAAFLIDVAIIIGALVVMTILCLWGLAALGKDSGPAMAAIWLLGFFVLRNLYFILFEMTPRAATPGKRVLGLRVASRSGGPLTADAILGRNAMRELEVFLPLTFLLSHMETADAWISLTGLLWTGVFALMPLFNRDRLRAGDIAAGTWVVKAPKQKLLKDLAERDNGAHAAFAFTQAQLDAYGVKELHVLEDVLRRFDAKTVKAVAERIRRKIDWPDNPHESDGDFLDAYYRALRGRLETRLLFGKRRVDKFDRD